MVVDPCGHCQAASSQFPHDTAFGRVLLPILLAFDMMSSESPTNKSFPPVPEGVSNVRFPRSVCDGTQISLHLPDPHFILFSLPLNFR
jgi:hypothetical protein